MARVAPLSILVDAWATSLHRHWVRVWLTSPYTRPHDCHTAPMLVLLRALTASALALLLLLLHKATHLVPLVPSLDEALVIVATAFVILLAARVAAAIQRWRLGNSDFYSLVQAARSIVLLACSFLSEELNVEAHAQFLSDLKRWTVAYVALAVDDCSQQQRSAVVLEKLRDLLAHDEFAILHATTFNNGNKAHAGVVELWLRCRVSHAGFTKAPERLLLPHAVQVMELQQLISSLPLLYENVRMAWKDPPVWGYWTHHAPFGILGYLTLYSLVRISTLELRVVLWVFGSGLVLFGLDSLAQSIENQHFTDDGSLHEQLLAMQHELHASLHAYFMPRHGLESLQQHNRSLPAAESPRSRDLMSPRSPTTRSSVSPSDELTKPSLKQVLDLITTDSTVETAIRPDERQPLLATSATTAATATARAPASASPRAALFRQYNTQRIDEDTTDDEDDDAESLSPA